MTEIEIFRNSEFELRIRPVGESFHVGAPELARALGFRQALDLVRSIPDEEKGYELVRTPGGEQRAWYLTEPGLYRALGQRQAARVKDDAMRDLVERFQAWVYREVLPAIRRTGRYEVQPARPVPDLDISDPRTVMLLAQAAERSAQLAIEQRERAEQAETALAIAAPKAESWDTLASGDGRWRAYQKVAIDTGRLSELPSSHYHPRTGELVIDPPQIRVKPKGLHELHRRLGGTQPLTVQPELEPTPTRA